MNQAKIKIHNDLDFSGIRQSHETCCICYSRQYNQQIQFSTIDYNVEIDMGIAIVTLKYSYQNTKEQIDDIQCLFAIHASAVFDSLNIQNGSRSFKAELKEIQEAQKQYQEGIKEGKKMVLSRKLATYPDIMKVEIGNLKKDDLLILSFSYIQRLELCCNKFWRLVLPYTLKERYGSQILRETLNVMEIEQQNLLQGIELKFINQLKFIESPTHKIDVEDQIVKIIIQNQLDCVIIFADDYINKIVNKVTYTNLDHLQHQKYCATLQLTPSVNALLYDDAYKQFLDDTYETQVSENNVFYFILDCSGSMNEAIHQAKKALILFLKSLPENSKFNILVFGNSFNCLFHNLKQNDDKNVQAALKKIQKIDADMGGTEIKKPLKWTFQQKVHKDEIKQIFLLTDGEVYSQEVYDLIIKSKNKNTRLHTIGLGYGCSTDFIITCAKLGGGNHIFISENESMNERIIGLLQEAITPYLSQINLNISDKKNINAMYPNIDEINYLQKNKLFTIQIFFTDQQVDPIDIEITAYDPLFKQNLSYKTTILFKQSTESNVYHKIMADRIIKSIQQYCLMKNDTLNDVLLTQTQVDDKFIVDLSLQYQVLSKLTAFITDLGYEEDQQLNYRSRDRSVVGVKGICRGRGGSLRCSRGGKGVMKKKGRSRSRSIDRKKNKKKSKRRESQSSSQSLSLSRNKKDSQDSISLISYQKSDGSFSDLNQLRKFLKSDYKDQIPKELNNDQWLTILFMMILQLRFQSDKKSWILVYNKSLQYLRRYKIDLQQFKQEAEQYIK